MHELIVVVQSEGNLDRSLDIWFTAGIFRMKDVPDNEFPRSVTIDACTIVFKN